jgi:hypothetical protein
MAEYMVYFNEMNDVRMSFLEAICQGTDIDAPAAVKQYLPAFRALHTPWPE